MSGMESSRILILEDELESILSDQERSEADSTKCLELMAQKLRSLVNQSDDIYWCKWPRDHVYEPVKRHILNSTPQEAVLKVKFEVHVDY